MPLVQAAEGTKQKLSATAGLAVGMVLVTGLFGAVVGTAGATITEVVSNRSLTAQIMKTAMIAFGLVMLTAGLGKLDLLPRLLRRVQLEAISSQDPGHRITGSYRRPVLVGATLAATFGIICTRPTYLALLLYVALVGSAAYGLLALSAYGIGLAVPVAVGGLALAPAGRATRVMARIAAGNDTIRFAQGVSFVLLGALVVSYFWFRYVVPSA